MLRRSPHSLRISYDPPVPTSVDWAVIILLSVGLDTRTCVRYDHRMNDYTQTILLYAQLHITSDGIYVATFPELPAFGIAVYAHGDSIEECIAAVERVLETYILWAQQFGAFLPEIDGIAPPSGKTGLVALIADTDG